MSLEDFFKVLSDIAMADTMSYWIVGAMSLLAAVLMRMMLPAKGLSLVFLPALFLGGLAGIYVASRLGFVFGTERSVQIVVTGTLGMTVALFVMIALTRLTQAALKIRNPLTIERRPA